MVDTPHAILSPSSSSRWMACPGSVILEATEPNRDNNYSREGTLAHALAAECLTKQAPAKEILILEHKGQQEIIPQSMIEHVQDYLDFVNDCADGQTLFVEQSLDLAPFTKEEGAKGTADAIILSKDGTQLTVIDFKYGYHEVDAFQNSQLRIYGLAALDQFGLAADFRKVKLAIHQPRIDNIDQEELTVRELEDFAAEIEKAVFRVEEARKSNSLDGFLNPGEQQCKWCRAAGKCPALAAQVAQITGADFEDETQTELVAPVDPHKALLKADLIELYVKGLRAKVEADLFSGEGSDYWKLVEGKKGNRQYDDENKVEAKIKKLKLKKEDTHQTTLLTPAKLEKKFKNNPVIWKEIQEHVIQKPGRPSVAHLSDPRPAYIIDPSADFEVVE